MKKPFLSIQPTLVNIVMAALMLLPFVFTDTLVIKGLVRLKSAQSFPQTSGKIDFIDAFESLQGYENSRLKIKYSYQVDGKTFNSQKIRNVVDHTITSISEYGRRYTNGATVVVFYNPDNPQDAVLERGFSKKDVFSPFNIVLACFNLLFLSLFGYLVKRRLNSQKKRC